MYKSGMEQALMELEELKLVGATLKPFSNHLH